MPLLGFKKRFAPAVEAYTKRQTIRACRKDGRDPKQGDTLHLYTGLRTKRCRKLAETECVATLPVTIHRDKLEISGIEIVGEARDRFARDDGFVSFYELADYFENEMKRAMPWSGIVVYW
jgi:hypothetical protein